MLHGDGSDDDDDDDGGGDLDGLAEENKKKAQRINSYAAYGCDDIDIIDIIREWKLQLQLELELELEL
ncbi:hypothetical protein AWZ03_009746 [Drosophila navojoa]|uniref:Uncharacterized protein n=1 Tax=Drosophila navojoa TaxID=7232 RepID=A0A484B7P4_DRONA|nr:hypothetical protein AWZ03_009746 [Drosophila navojoa]